MGLGPGFERRRLSSELSEELREAPLSTWLESGLGLGLGSALSWSWGSGLGLGLGLGVGLRW